MKDIHLLGKKVLMDKSPIVLKSAPDENWEKDWMVMSGEWHYEDGALIGTEFGNRGGNLFSRECFDKDVMISFDVSTVLPATRDLNAVFCAYWNDETGHIGESYICGLNGWYENKAGIERNLSSNLYSTTGIYEYEPGTEVRMTAGAINGHCFMVVDDKIVTELIDPNPIRGGHVGFSPFCTRLRIRNIEVREIVWKPFEQSYEPEFS